MKGAARSLLSSAGRSQSARHHGTNSTVLTVIGRLEARLLNPLIAESNSILQSVEDLRRAGAEVPLTYARDAVHLMAVRREYKAMHKLLSYLEANIFRANSLSAIDMGKGQLPVCGSRRLDPFSVLAQTAVSNATYYSSSGGQGGLFLWNELYQRYGHFQTRDGLLSILYFFERGGKLPSSFVLKAVVGTIVDNRWDQTPSFQLTLLRLMQRYFHPDKALRRHFLDDLNLLKWIVENAKRILPPDGTRVLQYELMHTWLAASQAARRLTDPNRLLRAEACLLEAMKLLDVCLTPISKSSLKVLPKVRAPSLDGGSAVEAAEAGVRQSMLLLAKELEAELAETGSTLRINSQKKGQHSAFEKTPKLLLTKDIYLQSNRGRAATSALLTELSGLGRHAELFNILHRLLSSSEFDFDSAFISNGIMDNSKIVQARDIIASPFVEGAHSSGYSYPSESAGQLEQLRRNVATKSVFRFGIDARQKDWTQRNRETNSVDWRGKVLAEVMLASKASFSDQGHMTIPERLGKVGDLATKIMAIAASHGVVLTDDFRAAWIEALPSFEESSHRAVGSTEQTAVEAADPLSSSHSIVKKGNSSVETLEGLSVTEFPDSGQFVYSIDRKEMVDVTRLARDAERALLENAALNLSKTPKPAVAFQSTLDKEAQSAANLDRVCAHVEDTIFGEFTVSSFSKSLRAGSAVLSDSVGEVSRGALVRYLAANFASWSLPTVLKMTRQFVDQSVSKNFPVSMWVSLIDATGKYSDVKEISTEIAALDYCLEECAVTQRHPEVLRSLLRLHHITRNGPDAVHVLRLMRRAGVSANYDLYRETVLALYRFKFDPTRHEKHAQLFLRPQETASWFLREMRRDGIKIRSEFYGDLMLLFMKNARVWAILDSESSLAESIYKPEYGGSDSVFTPSSVSNRNHLEEVIGDAITFLMNCVNHRSHQSLNEDAKADGNKRMTKTCSRHAQRLFTNPTSVFDRGSRAVPVASPSTANRKEFRTINGKKFLYRVETPLFGIPAQRETLLRRLLIIVCETGKYDLARELLTNSISTFGIAPTSRCYEVLLHSLLLKTPPDVVPAEDLISEMMNSGLSVTSAMLDLFGQAYLNRKDASEALDAVQELSMQHRVMPSPAFLRKLIEFSLERGDEMEAKRVAVRIRDMKWDQAAVRPSVAKLHNLFPDSSEHQRINNTEDHHSLTGSLIDAMKMLFSGYSTDKEEETKDRYGSNSRLVAQTGSINASSPYCYERGWDGRNTILSAQSIKELFHRYNAEYDDSNK